MKNFVRICCLAIVLCLVGYIGWTDGNPANADVCAPSPNANLLVSLRPQNTVKWCWAASGEMCMEYTGNRRIQQCRQANNRLNRPDCCNINTPMNCIKGGFPEFEKYGFSANKTTNRELTWDQIKDQISCRRKPVAFSWHWWDGTGHMMVIRGYKTESGINYVYINDPAPAGLGGTRFMPYSSYISSQGYYTHWDDFYNISNSNTSPSR